MIVQGKLFVEGEVRNILAFDLLFEQGTDWSGKPSRKSQLEGVYIHLESTKDDDLFHHWITSNHTMKQGRIIFYGPDGMKEWRKYEFWDCVCVSWQEKFWHNTTDPMGMKLKLIPAIFKTPGGTIAEKNWKISNPFQGYMEVPWEEEEEEKDDQKYYFKKGQSPFEIKEINYVSGGELVTAGYGELEISPKAGAPEGLQGQVISTGGASLGAGIGLPVEVMTGAIGTIEFHQDMEGYDLEDIFSSTGYISVKSISALLKYTRINAYTDTNSNTLLWTANLYGGGVISAGLSGNRSTVKFKRKK
ncbi:hypothetical protein ED312_06585 [Sinomicrobium pectinilyticum]|uniref:Uncharacterized protein n=1 Tax=Sinomicrobium pectinilyticum TaxID=1084421 RepID=A0A3N0EQ94_SINP1|nr:type VI secretion system tube protein TssD [Sinomicrobium pectinilyticum]RNL90088.1 hypothetical protein ED312_06585 [Sinomicrobium pectinilyticum]